MIALSVAAVLAIFLLYTSIAGGGNPSISPSELGKRTEKVQLAGLVTGPVRGDSHAAGLRFGLRDIDGGALQDRKSTRLNSSHYSPSRMPSSA